MENRICVYTVCMNESKFVDKWVDSMSEADKIVALVHDCTDDTEEKLLARGVIVEHAHYDEWRFDVGKNDSMHAAMKNAPDCNILCFTSLDEIWDPGWAQILKDNWTEDTNICLYKFVQSHNDDGSDNLVTGFNWIHSNDPAWYWKYPIDERICRDDQNFKYVDLFNVLKLNHWPDLAKPRPYVDLRRKMYNEYQDASSLVSLARDYYYVGKNEELFTILKEKDIDSLSLDKEEKSFLFACLASLYWKVEKNIEKTVDLFKQGISADSTFRIPYLWFGRILCDIKLYCEAEFYLKEGLSKTHRHYTWLENAADFEGEMFIWLTVATYYKGKYLESLAYATRALDLMPKSELAQNNLRYCKEAVVNIV